MLRGIILCIFFWPLLTNKSFAQMYITIVDCSCNGKTDFHGKLFLSFQIACSQEPQVIPTHLCPGLQDLTARCLQLIPDSRPQAKELVHHPVFAELFHWWSHTVLFYTTTYLLTYLFMVTHVQNVLLIHYCINYLCIYYLLVKTDQAMGHSLFLKHVWLSAFSMERISVIYFLRRNNEFIFIK